MRLIRLYLLLFLFTALSSQAQRISAFNLKLLVRKEDSLQLLSQTLNLDSNQGVRMRSDSSFIRTLVRTLQMEHFFDYPFPILKGISILYAPDSSFKLST